MGKYSGSEPLLQDVELTPNTRESAGKAGQDIEVNWYIVTLEDGHCDVVAIEEGKPQPDRNAKGRRVWGPFQSHEGAIARRIGLIRAGKCKPH